MLRTLHAALDDAELRTSRRRADAEAIAGRARLAPRALPARSPPRPASLRPARGADATTDAVIAGAQRHPRPRRRDRSSRPAAARNWSPRMPSSPPRNRACAQSREDVDRGRARGSQPRDPAAHGPQGRRDPRRGRRCGRRSGRGSITRASATESRCSASPAGRDRSGPILALGGDATTLENLETGARRSTDAVRWRSRRRARGHATRRCGAAGARPRGGAGATRGVICGRPGARAACAARRRAGHAASDRRPRGRARRL